MGGKLMRHVYIVVFLAWGVLVTAQPRLDVRSLPAPTASFVLGIADTTNVKVGAAGPNVRWDFKQLRRLGVGVDSITIEYLSPSATPPQAQALFPTAQVAVRTGPTFEFFRTEGTMFRLLGAWTPSTALTSGTANPYDTRPVEITYSGQHFDTYRSTLTSPVDPKVQQRAGTVTFMYDGFGLLELPRGVVSNVARTRTITQTTDTARYTSPTVRVVVTATDIDSYRWTQVTNSIPFVVVNFSTVRVTNNGQAVSRVTSKEVFFRDTINPIASSVDDVDDIANVDVYPNPARSNNDVVLSGVLNEVLDAELVDLQGNRIPVTIARISATSMRVAIPSVAGGTYALVVRTITGVIRKQVVVMP